MVGTFSAFYKDFYCRGRLVKNSGLGSHFPDKVFSGRDAAVVSATFDTEEQDTTMRHITTVAIISAFLLSPAIAGDSVPASVKQYSLCMAYYAVANGLDGKKEVGAETTAIISDIGTMLYQEGFKANMTSPQIQDAVVNDLEKLNLAVQKNGLSAATKDLKVGCDDLVSHIRGIH